MREARYRTTWLAFCTLALLVSGCSDSGGSDDPGGSGEPDVEAPVDADDGPPDEPDTDDGPPDELDTDDGPPDVDLPAGIIDTAIPSTAAAGEGLFVRIYHPSTAARRYADGAPVVVDVPGGWGEIHVLDPEAPSEVEEHGLIRVYFLLPGGSSPPDLASGGTYDIRGPDCVRAVADVVRFAAGDAADVDGKLITDHVPHALTSNVGIAGGSNGGNLAIAAMAQHGDELDVQWFAAWESPIGDQYAAVELNDNPFHEPGACSATSCPLVGLAEALAFDPGGTTGVVGDMGPDGEQLPGVLYAEVDGDPGRTAGDFVIERMPPGPGPAADKPKLYPSVELRTAIEASDAFAGGPGAPAWLASEAEVQSYWDIRDGAVQVTAAHANLADLLVMHVGTEKDHAQNAIDYPHARSHVQAWLDAGHAWVRLNPDAAYVSLVSGVDAGSLSDNDANEPVPFPGTIDVMVPENVDGVKLDPHLGVAAHLELADRVQVGDTSDNLDAVLAAD